MTVSDSSPTWSQPCSFAAVTRTDSSGSSASTAWRTFDPLVRVTPSYPARPPLSGVDRGVRLS